MSLASNIWQFLQGSVLGRDGWVSKVPHLTLTKVCAISFMISGHRRRQALRQEDGAGIKPAEGPEATGGGTRGRRTELSLRVGPRRAAEAGRSAAQDRSG